jgi:hypothetical protein
MKKYYLFPLLSVFSLFFASCDEHEVLDLDVHTGNILCDDGQVLSTDAYFSQDASKAVAVVFAPQTEEHPVLAVLLDEIAPVAFCDSLGLELGTSCDETAFDGYENTTAMQNNRDSRSGKGSPLADEAFTYHYYWQSDYIPSVSEMGLLYLARDQVNPILERCGGTPLYDDAAGSLCWYWTSTEVEQNKGRQAWLFSMSDGSRHRAPKTNEYRARAIVEYNPLNIH